MFSRARAAIDAFFNPELVRSAVLWDGAGNGNRLKGWTPRAQAANQQFDNPIWLRGRAEGEFRNNSFARRIADCIGNATTGGTGIGPQFRSKRAQLVWGQWGDVCDAAGRMDWAAMVAQVLQTVIVSGEAFVLFSYDDAAPGVPLRLSVLGPEYLDTSRVDGSTMSGIRYSGARRTGYWLHRQNPVVAATLESVFVPASECLHVFRPIAPGAQRGQSWLAPCLLPLRELNAYLEAGLVKAQVSSLFAGFVRSADGSNPLLNADGVPSLEPGAMTRLKFGEEVEFTEPPDAGTTFDPFVRCQLRRIAAAVGVPYELLSGDSSQITFASGRHALLEFRRTVEVVQHGLLVPQLCAPVLRRWAQLGAALGMVSEAETAAVRWIGPTVEMLDPRTETLAQIQRVRAGFCSRSEVIAQTGWRAEDVDAEIAADNARADQLGIVLDTNPGKTTLQGQEQTSSGQEQKQ